MTRFYFDVRQDGQLTVDSDGIEFATLEDARREAQRALSEMAAEAIRRSPTMELLIEIRTAANSAVAEAVAWSTVRDKD